MGLKLCKEVHDLMFNYFCYLCYQCAMIFSVVGLCAALYWLHVFSLFFFFCYCVAFLVGFYMWWAEGMLGRKKLGIFGYFGCLVIVIGGYMVGCLKIVDKIEKGKITGETKSKSKLTG
jgi:hypothetical protein